MLGYKGGIAMVGNGVKMVHEGVKKGSRSRINKCGSRALVKLSM